MMQHHNYSLVDLENMMPGEREICVGLLLEFIKEQEEEQKKEQAKQ